MLFHANQYIDHNLCTLSSPGEGTKQNVDERTLAAFWVRPSHTGLYQDLKRSSITMPYRRLIMGPIPKPHSLGLLIEWPFSKTGFKSCLFHCWPIYTFWKSFNTHSRKALGSSGNRSDEIPSKLTPFPIFLIANSSSSLPILYLDSWQWGPLYFQCQRWWDHSVFS